MLIEGDETTMMVSEEAFVQEVSRAALSEGPSEVMSVKKTLMKALADQRNEMKNLFMNHPHPLRPSMRSAQSGRSSASLR